MKMLTEHFSEAELGVECKAEQVRMNAQALCEQVLEPVRAKFGAVEVHCGFRSVEHNGAVGGKKNSWHLYDGGHAAADFHVKDAGMRQVFDWLRLKSELPFDKVILESSGGQARCIHVQMDCAGKERREAFTGATGAGTSYTAEVVA